MSDPVTNVQIEDVLSSIRRLVSEDARPRRPSTAPAPATGRLVLSPALRVPDSEQGRAEGAAEPPMVLTGPALLPVEDVADAMPQDETPAAAAALLLDEVDRAEPEETLFDPDQDADPTAQEDPPEGMHLADGPDSALRAVPVDSLEEQEPEAEQRETLRSELAEGIDDEVEDDLHLESMFDGWTEEGEPDPTPELSAPEHDSALERKIAALEQMLHRQAHRWTPAPGAQDPDADNDASLTPDLGTAENDLSVDFAAPQIEPADFPAEEAEADHTAAIEAPEIDISAVAEAARTAAIPEEVAVRAETPDRAAEGNSAQDHTDAEAMAGKPAFVRHPARPSPATLEWEDHAPTASTPKPPAQVGDEDEVSAASAAVAELSEEALHAMVAEIIRAELQGVLGERITRNVRKLVRREIHRVLMSQEFD